ncbi:MAG: cyclodeaminase/cyclohydrolase family protein [Phycisphaerales bacterium]|nr:cyclodeaminase/cyclohydrolase family protein [Phycisphaerales bacterium]
MGESSFLKTSLSDFVERLASAEATPGGGAVAALAGALAAALGSMAAELTTSKAKYAEVHAPVAEIAGRLGRARRMLAALLDDDAAAYEALSAVMKRPKDDPSRSAALAEAAAAAAAVPLQIATLARKVRLDLARLVTIANPNLRSDVEVGLHMARAAMHGAAIMVRVNLPMVGGERAEQVERELNELLADPSEHH